MKGILNNKGKSWYLCAIAAVIALVTALYILFSYKTVLPNSLNGTDIVLVLLIGVVLQVVVTVFPLGFAPLLSVICYGIAFGLVLNKIPPAIVDKINGIFYNGGNFEGCMIYATGTCAAVLLSLIACFLSKGEEEKSGALDKLLTCLAAVAVVAVLVTQVGGISPAPAAPASSSVQEAETQKTEDPDALKIAVGENAFRDYTAEEFAAIPMEEWAAKVDSVGIAYDFNGQYTEAFGTKYYFMGYSQHVDVQGEDTVEVVSAPDGDVLTPEIKIT